MPLDESDGRLTPRPSPSRPRKLQRSPAGSDSRARSRAPGNDVDADGWQSYVDVECALASGEDADADPSSSSMSGSGPTPFAHLQAGPRPRDPGAMGLEPPIDLHASPSLSYTSSSASSGASPRTPAPAAFSVNTSSTGGIGYTVPALKKDPSWSSALSSFGAAIKPASHNPSPAPYSGHVSRASIDLRSSPMGRPSSPAVIPLGSARLRDGNGGGDGASWLRSVRGRRRAPADSPADRSSALNFEPAVADWHALLTYAVLDAQKGAPAAAWAASSPEIPPAPQHVLDVGCGTGATWTLHAAQWPPWATTRFVGLDAAPVGVDLSLLPRSIAERVSFYQLSFLDPWPFRDGAFDLIRLGFLGLSVPETAWTFIVEQAARVCKPGTGRIEIVDVQLGLDEASGAVALATVPAAASDPNLHASDPAYWHARFGSSDFSVREGLYAVQAAAMACDRAGVSMNPISLIPSHLVLDFDSVASSGTRRIVEPDAPTGSAIDRIDPSEPSFATTDTDVRVLHHATAALNLALADKQHEAYDPDRRADIWPPLDATRVSSKESARIAEALAQDRRGRAGLSALLSSRLGWRCQLDEAIEPVLVANLTDIENQQRAAKAAHQAAVAAGKATGAVEHIADLRSAQLHTQTELTHVRQRLDLAPPPASLGPALGAIELAQFSARRPAVARW